MSIEAKQDVLLAALGKFYASGDHLAVLRGALDGGDKVSLRVLDWLVTNYAKKRNIVYTAKLHGHSTAFNMFLEYKSQLKAYSKRLLDPFCRRERISFCGLETTVGQLNFFRWAIQSGVLEYAREHYDEIERDMLASIQHRYAREAAPKRTELSRAAVKTCTTTKLTVKVKFT